MAFTTAEKDAFSDEAYQALKHPLVDEVVDELLFNLKRQGDALARYGIRKVAMYAAVVARAQALGIDPDELRMTRGESDEVQMQLAEAAMKAGKPVIVVTTES